MGSRDDRTLADRVRGLKEAAALVARIRNKIVPLGVQGYLDGLDRARELVESLARDLDRAPVTGDVRGMAEEALRLDAERMTPRLKLQVFEADDGATWRRLATALARALLAAPVAPASDEPSAPDFLTAVREARAKLSAAGIRLRDHDEDVPADNPFRAQDGCDGEHHTFNAGGVAYLVACPKCFTLARAATRTEPKAPTGEE